MIDEGQDKGSPRDMMLLRLGMPPTAGNALIAY